jgi:AcrR family transcriptional regulator
MTSRKDPRKQAVQARSVATIAAILDATEQLAKAHGLETITPSAVAKRAGVATGTIYQYFPGKEAIIAAWRERSFEQDREDFARLLVRITEERAPLPDAIRLLVRWGFDLLVRRMSYFRDPAEAEFAARATQFEQTLDAAVGLIAGHLQEAPDRPQLRDKDFRVAAALVLRTVGYLGFDAGRRTLAPDARAVVVAELEDMVLRYLLVDGLAPK